MEKEALESLLSKFEVWQVIFACLVAVGVAGEFVVGWMHVQKGKRLHKIEQVEDSKRQETIETLRNENLKLQRLIHEPRAVDEKRANEILDWGAKGSVEISFVANNDDASNLGQVLHTLLISHGWSIPNNMNAVVSPGSTLGITITLNGEGWDTSGSNPVDGLPEPAKTLYKCLNEAVKGNPSLTVRADRQVSKDVLVVMIGPKY